LLLSLIAIEYSTFPEHYFYAFVAYAATEALCFCPIPPAFCSVPQEYERNNNMTSREVTMNRLDDYIPREIKTGMGQGSRIRQNIPTDVNRC